MNKQVVIASLIAATSAEAEPVPCDDAFVALAQNNLDDAKSLRGELEDQTGPLVETAGQTYSIWEADEGRRADQATLMAPFVDALTLAQENYSGDSDDASAATAALAALTAPVAAATAAKGVAQGLVDDAQADIDAQQLIVDKLDAAQVEHTTELATMQGLLDTATAEYDAAVQTKADKDQEIVTLTAERDTATTGQAALQAVTGQALVDATADYDTAIQEEVAAAGTYQPAKLAYDKKVLECQLIDSGCTGNKNDDGAGDVMVTGVVTQTTCVGQTNDPILAMKTACDTARDGSISSTKDTQVAAWDPAVTKVATKWNDKTTADIADKAALSNLATINSSISTAEALVVLFQAEVVADPGNGIAGSAEVPAGTLVAAVTAKSTAKDTAQTNWDTVNGQLTQANADLGRGEDLMASLVAALVPLNDDLVVATYLETVQLDLQAVQEEAKAAAQANLEDLENLVTMAQATVDRAQVTMDFYEGLATAAKAASDLDAGMVADNAAAILQAESDIEDFEGLLEAAISNCKVAGFTKAQGALKALMDAEEDRRDAVADVADSYAKKSAFSDSGETNTLCAFPPKAKDAAQEPRPLCSEGYCCGAAQKFLKDGTKLAIETCQKAEGVHTYTFWPPLPEGSVVEPTPETWRFQCISGAQKLIAATTALLAASYMMA